MSQFKVFFECGCKGNVSSHNIFQRIISCDEHKAISEILRPGSKVLKTEEYY